MLSSVCLRLSRCLSLAVSLCPCVCFSQLISITDISQTSASWIARRNSVIDSAWASAKQLRAAVYVGYPDGMLLGYGTPVNASGKLTLPFFLGANGTLSSFAPDYYGEPTDVLVSRPVAFNATLRPWCKSALGR